MLLKGINELANNSSPKTNPGATPSRHNFLCYCGPILVCYNLYCNMQELIKTSKIDHILDLLNSEFS